MVKEGKDEGPVTQEEEEERCRRELPCEKSEAQERDPSWVANPSSLKLVSRPAYVSVRLNGAADQRGASPFPCAARPDATVLPLSRMSARLSVPEVKRGQSASHSFTAAARLRQGVRKSWNTGRSWRRLRYNYNGWSQTGRWARGMVLQALQTSPIDRPLLSIAICPVEQGLDQQGAVVNNAAEINGLTWQSQLSSALM